MGELGPSKHVDPKARLADVGFACGQAVRDGQAAAADVLHCMSRWSSLAF
jgi:hypothetical protein